MPLVISSISLQNINTDVSKPITLNILNILLAFCFTFGIVIKLVYKNKQLQYISIATKSILFNTFNNIFSTPCIPFSAYA